MTTFWMARLETYPTDIKEVVLAQIAAAEAAGQDYTAVREVMVGEPVYTACCGWVAEVGRCRKPVTHVRYLVGGNGEGMPQFFCSEGAKEYASSVYMDC